jgi:hypothetical protein
MEAEKLAERSQKRLEMLLEVRGTLQAGSPDLARVEHLIRITEEAIRLAQSKVN